MFLTKLEVQGFKTFAKKTTLHFLPPKGEHNPITSVVGPNGSGKSNLADAMRWVLGEQSLKLLRGKKSEDIIFSGSEGHGRAGFAEVSITFNNEDKAMPVDYAEVTITRRLYRDGESDYLLNGSSTRLLDIQLLLAQANVGQRSYSVVGQGMVDHILVASPEERKAFFDDATGVRQFQIKRREALLKLKRTHENLVDIEMLLNEIEPRMRSLKRQVSRLEQREEVEKTLHELERQYYGTMWWQLEDQFAVIQKQHGELEAKIKGERNGLEEMEKRVNVIEQEERGKETQDSGLLNLQKQYQDIQKERQHIRDEHFEIRKSIEMANVRAQSVWTPLPLLKIIEEVTRIETEQKEIIQKVKTVKTIEELRILEPKLEATISRTTQLLKHLERPVPEDVKPDPIAAQKLDELAAKQKNIEEQLKSVEHQIETCVTKEKAVRTELLDLQKEFRAKQQSLHALENRRNTISIELARLEERKKNLSNEMDEQLAPPSDPRRATSQLPFEIRSKRIEKFFDATVIHPEIQRLRYKLELIGSIEPETVKEFEETKTRFEFLDGQVKDLRQGMKDIEKAIDELDKDIHEQSEKAFKDINHQFQRFFKMLFGGGTCGLMKLTREDLTNEEAEETQEHLAPEYLKEFEDRVVGIDIQATPPGKRIKALNLLSGGERALTSIALLSAIMAVNPSPFVVLDEVDAALDEANTIRFADILGELSKLTQFIIITHNRATMEKASMLYGVTMGDDGVSNLLSVKLEDVQESRTARR